MITRASNASGRARDGARASERTGDARPRERRGRPARAFDASAGATEASASAGGTRAVAFTFRSHERRALEALREACGPLTRAETPTPADAARKTNERAGITTTTEVWRSSRLRRVRSTYVDGGEAAQVFNLVAYPSPSAPDAPVLGIDLICVGKGSARKVLIGVDLQPMSRDRGYAATYVPTLLALRERGGRLESAAAALNATTPSNKFYEDAKFFSQGMFFARPLETSEEVMKTSLEVVEAYVDVWLARLDEAEREAEAMDGACKFGLSLEDVRRCVLTEKTAREAQDALDAWQLEHDPAIPMFTGWYGEEWSTAFAQHVLFPGDSAL